MYAYCNTSVSSFDAQVALFLCEVTLEIVSRLVLSLSTAWRFWYMFLFRLGALTTSNTGSRSGDTTTKSIPDLWCKGCRMMNHQGSVAPINVQQQNTRFRLRTLFLWSSLLLNLSILLFQAPLQSPTLSLIYQQCVEKLLHHCYWWNLQCYRVQKRSVFIKRVDGGRMHASQ